MAAAAATSHAGEIVLLKVCSGPVIWNAVRFAGAIEAQTSWLEMKIP
jgi:hypothetical protein